MPPTPNLIIASVHKFVVVDPPDYKDLEEI